MIRSIAIAAAALMLAGAAHAHEMPGKQAHSHPTGRTHAHAGPTVTQEIRVDCFRGPWKETIWDHPRPVFIDDLVLFGYEYADALAIATRVCRDPAGIGNPDVLSTSVINAIAETPPGH